MGSSPLAAAIGIAQKCQTAARDRWIAARRKELLPTRYVHVSSRFPLHLAPLVLQNKKVIYHLLSKTNTKHWTNPFVKTLFLKAQTHRANQHFDDGREATQQNGLARMSKLGNIALKLVLGPALYSKGRHSCPL
jgi:hypothetical protein